MHPVGHGATDTGVSVDLGEGVRTAPYSVLA